VDVIIKMSDAFSAGIHLKPQRQPLADTGQGAMRGTRVLKAATAVGWRGYVIGSNADAWWAAAGGV